MVDYTLATSCRVNAGPPPIMSVVVVVSISRLYSKMKNSEIYLKKGLVLETEETTIFAAGIYYLGSYL